MLSNRQCDKKTTFLGELLGKSCSHDPKKFKTGFNSSLSIPVHKKRRFFTRPAIILFASCKGGICLCRDHKETEYPWTPSFTPDYSDTNFEHMQVGGLSFGIRLEYRPLDGLEKSVPVPIQMQFL
jgi:hypothetical protein